MKQDGHSTGSWSCPNTAAILTRIGLTPASVRPPPSRATGSTPSATAAKPSVSTFTDSRMATTARSRMKRNCWPPVSVEPLPLAETDPDILWHFNIHAEVGSYPHDSAHGSFLLDGDQLYLNTGNGVDNTHRRIRAPEAPSLIVLDKQTGTGSPRTWSGSGRASFTPPGRLRRSDGSMARARSSSPGATAWCMPSNR
jgi:hypothetical protein